MSTSAVTDSFSSDISPLTPDEKTGHLQSHEVKVITVEDLNNYHASLKNLLEIRDKAIEMQANALLLWVIGLSLFAAGAATTNVIFGVIGGASFVSGWVLHFKSMSILVNNKVGDIHTGPPAVIYGVPHTITKIMERVKASLGIYTTDTLHLVKV